MRARLPQLGGRGAQPEVQPVHRSENEVHLSKVLGPSAVLASVTHTAHEGPVPPRAQKTGSAELSGRGQTGQGTNGTGVASVRQRHHTTTDNGGMSRNVVPIPDCPLLPAAT